MSSALGHCEDPACVQSSSSPQEIVRLFRCSIHCDRHLCLHHLNAHNVYYEQEKKQSDVILAELRNSLSIYQSLFEQQKLEYRELVHQATSMLLNNTTTLVPIEQIRPVLEKVQRAIAAFGTDKTIIKCEPVLSGLEIKIENIESIPLKDSQTIKKEDNAQNMSDDVARRVVVLLKRVNCDKNLQTENRPHGEQLKKDQIRKSNGSCTMENLLCLKNIESDNEITIKANSGHHAETMRSYKCTDDDPRDISSTFATKKKIEKIKKASDKTIPLKRLQT